MASTERLRFCETERDEEVLIVRLRRPEVGNALHGPANEELAGVFDAFSADEALRAAVVTGYGSSFSVGSEVAGDALPPSGFGGLTRRGGNVKPMVAAVNGDAVDEGFELALACDLIVAIEGASFGLRRSGTTPTDRFDRIFRQVPLKRAMAALLTGRSIPAPEGVLLGFVNDLANPDDLLQLARSLAKQAASRHNEGVGISSRVGQGAS